MEEDSLTLPACRCMLTAAARQDWQQHQQQGLNTQKARTAPERGKRGRRCRRTKRRRARAGGRRTRTGAWLSFLFGCRRRRHSLTHSPLATGSKSNWILHATATTKRTDDGRSKIITPYPFMHGWTEWSARRSRRRSVITQGLAYVPSRADYFN